MLLVCAPRLPADLAAELNASGRAWKCISDVDEAIEIAPADGWEACVVAVSDVENSAGVARSLTSAGAGPLIAVLDAVPHDIAALNAFTDVIILPARNGEVMLRVELALRHADPNDGKLVHGPVRLDPTRYQVSLNDRHLDLTYMEYELLKHFVIHAGEVSSREDLLRHVWGYEYFGGGRTVDVHVRRLRAKFGQEHAHLISTVRSVGYRFSERNDFDD